MVLRLLPRPSPGQRTDPVQDASIIPSPENNRRTVAFFRGGLDSPRHEPLADHRPEPRHGKETVSTARRRLARWTPPRFSATVPAPNRSTHPSSRAFSGEVRPPFVPSRPTTSRCDPYRLSRGSSVARTSRADHVIPPIPFQDGWSTLHAVPARRDCKHNTSFAPDLKI